MAFVLGLKLQESVRRKGNFPLLSVVRPVVYQFFLSKCFGSSKCSFHHCIYPFTHRLSVSVLLSLGFPEGPDCCRGFFIQVDGTRSLGGGKGGSAGDSDRYSCVHTGLKTVSLS